MKALGILAIVWLSLCGLALIILHIKSHRFIKSVLIHATLGFSAMFLINITQKLTGVYIPPNWWTVTGSGILGLPGVCGILLLQAFV